jgi:hypothetical protein
MCEFTSSRPGKQPEEVLLRDYFAGQALAGLMANSVNISNEIKNNDIRNDIANYAYSLADAMMKARE